MTAIITNPRKSFNFKAIVTFMHYNPYTVQEVETPTIEIDKVAHGQGNHHIQTAGQVTYTNGILKGVIPQQANTSWIRVWLTQIQNVLSMGGQIPEVYKKSISIQFMGVDGLIPLEAEIWVGAWPCKLNGKSLKAIGSENILDEIEFSVDKVLSTQG